MSRAPHDHTAVKVARRPPLHAVILAGGRGTRFWPRSRRRRAKQVLKVLGEETLIQQTVARLRPLVPAERTWVITNHDLRAEIIRQLPEVPPEQIVAEPAQRNTAPAIGLAAHLVAARDGRAALIGVFPADHLVARPAEFRRVIQAGLSAAAAGQIVVLGIRPRWPETGYGYVEFRSAEAAAAGLPQPVARFREKPTLRAARRYLRGGRHFWNAGIFLWSAGTILEALEEHLPATAAVLERIARELSGRKQRSRAAAQRTLARLYPRCENISIDYAVLEKAKNVAGIPGDFGWNDVGSWKAVYELMPRDASGNAVRGDAWVLDARGNYLDVGDVPGTFVAAIGVEDLLVVDTPDALLIVHRDRAQDVSQAVKWLAARRRTNLL